ncbi:MAG TPA: SigE family RNA polymerase sigma factor [Actinomycetota bacterium]|nr:SigE family RNA polymerase sigma factor [Actinomycetota bacterium]
MSLGVAVAETGRGRLAELYVAHAPGAMRLAYLMTGDRNLAEDIVQEAFIKLAGRFRDLRNPDAFGAYLRTTVINLTRGHFRRKRVERAYLEKERGRTEGAESMPDVEGREEMWAALQRLPHRQRAVIVLRYYEDLSERQAADVLGCSVGAVKSLTNRAVESLREQMKVAKP